MRDNIVTRFTFLVISVLLLVSLFGRCAHAQTAPPKAEIHAWMDIFVGAQAPTLYPQYGWRAKTKIGTFSGYGFVERSTGEPLFANNLVIWTPPGQKLVSIRTETGGRLADFNPVPGKIVHPGAFFQYGPQVSIVEAVPPIKKVMKGLVATYLPKLGLSGIRRTNYLVGFGTQSLKLPGHTEVRLEGFRRFFGDHVPDYAEYWLLVHPKAAGPFTAGAWVLHDGKRAMVGFGGRLSAF